MTALLLTGGLYTTPASAATQLGASTRCVTTAEFWSVKDKTRDQAEAILDWEGASWKKPETGVNTWNRRQYRGCNGSWSRSIVKVRYEDDIVIGVTWVTYH
jgi:hypothetical protein